MQRFLLLLLAVLCLGSHLPSVAYSAQTFQSSKRSSGESSQHQHPLTHFQSSLSDIEDPSFYESMPAEEEDEENRKLNCSEFKSVFTNERIYTELFYSYYLRIRFQQLNLQKATHPIVSYQVLYHSWKSHLA